MEQVIFEPQDFQMIQRVAMEYMNGELEWEYGTMINLGHTNIQLIYEHEIYVPANNPITLTTKL